ncbi:MAG TPA: FAD-dependent oxidoreductase, partial [bacterium]|nr:FAD-dependent oxidoreductase [bacterium]
MKIEDILSPFNVWKRAFSKTFTTRKPLEERPGAKRYRGFHKNDLEKCIGCGSCEEICQNAAIDMVPVEGQETTDGDSGLRPKIDYGRCCWCALCVDICPSNSLSMSNEYIWIDEDADNFRFVAGNENKPWDELEEGYRRKGDYRLTDPERIEMEMENPERGIKSFIEMVKGYSKEQALKEADRCVECGICVATCPAHMDIPRYIKAIREDDLEEAVELLYKTNPMPATCGRICTRKCEDACAIGADGEPIAIRWLKRYIIDQIEDPEIRSILQEKQFAEKDQKIAIIGAGPGGLSAAYYLRNMGYQVTIYEAHENPGGEIWYGVPEYRMPYKELKAEIDRIQDLGVEMKFNTEVGVKVDFQDLYDNHDAVFISTGLTQPYNLRIEGEDLPGVISGLDFLEKVAQGEKPEIGSKVLVIGGGNVAIDAARTSRRLGSDVEILYRRREVDMPADE